LKFSIKIDELVKITGGVPRGNTAVIISGINPIFKSKIGDLTFFRDAKYVDDLKSTKASAILIKKDSGYDPNPEQVFIEVDDPYKAIVNFAYYLENINMKKDYGIHETAVIHNTAKIGKNASIGPNCFIDEHVTIGNDVTIRANSVISRDVNIGNSTYIYPNVSINSDTNIGNNCIIYSGAVLGSEGFGYVEDENGKYTRIPQVGNVVIEDDVEIGANTTIDRAMIGSTTIKRGTKIDNLVHVAHNCEIGEDNGIAAQAGISGSVKTGNRNRLAGQVGIAGHISIPDDVTIMAQSGIPNNVTKPGVYFGSPAKPRLSAFKIEAALRNLPETVMTVNKIKKQLGLDKK
jgi:UDP-3-O-[3-hydroxymyristoyl] glucosamine N-acyltransferase